ncbi:MAG: nucleotidyltransferase domain-containing protein [Defluviitaleaceae bacterium]|nr:nucleotidyltransferase domain-containing protein [Defluviitaleaceae bacterium]
MTGVKYKHHEDSIKNMTAHFRENPEIEALFLIGSIVTGTAREDSDIDGVAIISKEAAERKKQSGGLLEVIRGKCTYDGGYFDIHYHTREDLKGIAQNGSEPMRNMFTNAQVLFCDEPSLPELVKKIPAYPTTEAEKKRLRFYCTFKQFYVYFWNCCKPEGFFRLHIADGMIFNLYRLILIENKILFPSMRRLEQAVIDAPKKPENIIGKVKKFMQTLSDEDCAALVESYETWTSYDFPKEHNTVMNNFADTWEWQ